MPWVKIHPYFLRGDLTLQIQWAKIHPGLLHSETFMVYTMDEIVPVPSSLKVWVNFHAKI